VLAKRFSFDLIVILLHTLVKLVRSHYCLFFFLLLFLLPFVVNKHVQNRKPAEDFPLAARTEAI